MSESGKSAAKQLPVLTFVVSHGPGTQPPGVQVHGAGRPFDYGPVQGSTACFPAACAHGSVTATTNDVNFKTTFLMAFTEAALQTAWQGGHRPAA